MMRFASSALLLSFLAALLSGCSSAPAADPGAGPEPIVVRAPDDYTYLGQADAMARPHLHDYWGGRTQVPILDLDVTRNIVLSGFRCDCHLLLGPFQPPDGSVVPQGTGNLTLTATFEDAPGDSYSEPTLWYRSPAMDDYQGPIQLEGQPIRIPVAPEDADLPHTGLSGWSFQVGIRAGPMDYIQFRGTMHLGVEAHRERPIPVFPGHPDLWQGRSEVRLVDAEGSFADFYAQDGSGLCNPWPVVSQSCPQPHRPMDGTLVPPDAAYIEVRIVVGADAPLGVGLYVNGADTRTRTEYAAAEQSGSTNVYRIEVRGNGDSPYARQSLWGFLVAGPDGRFIEMGSYAIEATVFREPPVGPVPFSASGGVTA